MAEVVYTSKATAVGGREGHVKSSDSNIDIDLVKPGTSGGTNPEQLFAAGYSSCFDGALNLIASKEQKEIDSEITAEVSLVKDPTDDGFKIAVELKALIGGVSQDEAEDLVEKAHDFCPYSKATRGNIDVTLSVETK
ncbi:organic hydroperoxide resistance protein [Alkalicoccobacillus porphyridii]|uniref:Organic hydroperoxide resistance protein n=1 Tax=Alkalicoccobacillus porphyridii TaxID=2597270 RepID=A0A553ZYN7_9BACI|nr:organic hydroperoxide resistance protein [Alkalicoccobacillus porphyridii]TSB46559.1 organic hydroperoxide resistance protein [Alkalicoccobacillus porphyridii]